MRRRVTSLKSRVVFICLFFCLRGSAPAWAVSPSQETASLTKKIMEAKSSAELYSAFEELSGPYFNEHRYEELIAFLRSLSAKKKILEPFAEYYCSLSRYRQLKYLEEVQDWDTYFSNGNAYREQIVEGLEKALKGVPPREPLFVYARLLLWRFHQDQQDTFSEQALAGLTEAVTTYAKEGQDIACVKEAADTLLSYGEKARARELYRLYVERAVSSEKVDDKGLHTIAQGFYGEGNIELAELVYDKLIERVMAVSKDKAAMMLLDIARLFAFKGTAAKDAAYAEKLFREAEAAAGEGIFDEELIYLRAFNLEKAKDYDGCKELYDALLTRFPKGAHTQEAIFKNGIIHTYVLGDLKTGREYFERLNLKSNSPSAHVISSMYQLGLLSQWEGDFAAAKDYYDALIQAAGGDFPETVLLAKERLREIEKAMPLEYNLKTFLDVSLKRGAGLLDAQRVELNASLCRLNKAEETQIRSLTAGIESGCMQVELQYLWSGHLGSVAPSSSQSSFATRYDQAGTKEINLVVVSLSGVVGASIDLVDVY